MQDELCRLVQDSELRIYVCGNASSMVNDVVAAFEQVAGQETVARMQKEKRFEIEAWS